MSDTEALMKERQRQEWLRELEGQVKEKESERALAKAKRSAEVRARVGDHKAPATLRALRSPHTARTADRPHRPRRTSCTPLDMSRSAAVVGGATSERRLLVCGSEGSGGAALMRRADASPSATGGDRGSDAARGRSGGRGALEAAAHVTQRASAIDLG